MNTSPKASNTVDVVVFGLGEGRYLKVLLVKRRDDPFKTNWAIPGGFVNMNETLDEAAHRELFEETHAEPGYLEQLYTFGNPGRDPRGRVISVAYLALVRPNDVTVRAGDDAADARWFDVTNPPVLAFDHKAILDMALRRLRSKLRWKPIGVGLLPDEFTLTELQHVYETILGRRLDKRNFRRKVSGFDILAPTRKSRTENHRPARLYRFDLKKYHALDDQGIDFEVA